MRKIFTFLCAALMSVGMFAATEVTITNSDFPMSGKSFTKDGVTVSAGNIDGMGNINGPGSFSTTLGNFTKIEITANNVSIVGPGWNGTSGKKTWTGNASSLSFNGGIMSMGMGVTLKFTIADPTVAVTGVTLNQNEAQMTVGGETLTLTATVNPNNATDQSVSWSTSDANVATVENGVVTAVAAGNATITVTTTDGSFTATCAVTVTAPEPQPATTVVTITDSDFPSEGQSFTKDGVTVSALAIDGMYGDISGPGSFSTTLGNFTKIEVNANYVGIAGEGWSGDSEHKTWTGNAASVSFDGAIYGIGEIVFTIEPAPAPAGDEITVTWNDPSGYGFEFTQDGVTLTCGEISYKDFYGPGTFTTDLGNFTKIEVYAGYCLFNGDGWSGDDNHKTWTGNAASVSFSNDIYVPTSIVFTIEPASTPEPEPEPEPQPTTVTWGATEFSSFGVDYLHDASRTVKGITVTVNAANNNFINVTEVGTLFNATIDNAFTFSTELGNITKIECTTIYTKGSLGDGWTIGANSATWEGNTNTLNFGNAGSMLVVSNIIFTIGGGSTPEPEPEPEPQPVTDPITPYADPQDASVYYSTFYDSNFKYELPANVEAYVADLSGANLLLTKIAEAGEVIPADNAVILKSTVTPFTLTPSDADAVTFTATNDLQGSDTQIATPANCYVLAGTDGVVGFYHYTAANLNAHKAYVVYSGSNQAPRRMPFVFDQATGVENVQGDHVQSTKVIENGVLYIIKNGVKYNAMGQEVK